MKPPFLFAALLFAVGFAQAAHALDVNRYAWEFPAATAIPEDSVARLKEELLVRIDEILASMGQYRMQSLIQGVVASPVFQMK